MTEREREQEQMRQISQRQQELRFYNTRASQPQEPRMAEITMDDVLRAEGALAAATDDLNAKVIEVPEWAAKYKAYNKICGEYAAQQRVARRREIVPVVPE